MKQQPAILGGEKVRTKPFLPRTTMGKEEAEAVLEVVKSDVLSAFLGGAGQFFNGGKKVKEFENKWAEKYGFKHAISVNSWTTGLMVACGAVGIEPGDEVICSPYTMSASATCALFYGGIPVFADIDPHTFCIDPASIEKCITPRTKAIIVVHIFGGCADMDPIMEIAKKHKLKVIEDAAQAPGVHYKGRPIGAIGDIGGFSLNFHKHIHTGEGGMLVTNDDEVALRSRLIRNHGENAIDAYGIENLSNVIGSNYRLTELQAAIGVCQLDRLQDYLKTRRELANYFTELLSGIDGLDVIQNIENGDHAFYVFPMKYDAEKIGLPRSLFVKAVGAELPEPKGAEGMALTAGYVKPLYLNPIYQKQIALGSKGFPFNYNEGVKYDYSKGICPIVEDLYEKKTILSPLIREPLTKEDVLDIANAIKKVITNSAIIKAAFPDANDNTILTPLDAANATDVR
jgi:dTDP-4-amino-4,6-dideoxygalactose transaminase